MEHVDNFKIFNENLKDIFNPQKSFNKKADSYLEKFKKTYEERSKIENILVECLFKLEFVNLQDSRFLGAAEAVLIMEDFIKPGGKFDYKEKEEKFLFITYKSKETYKDVIIRLAKKYLTEKGVI